MILFLFLHKLGLHKKEQTLVLKRELARKNTELSWGLSNVACKEKYTEISKKLNHVVRTNRKVYILSDKVRQCMTGEGMNCRVTVRFDEDFMNDIELTCKQYHYKKSEFVREAIRRFTKNLSEGD
jgi:metal-responsive CopG/Arc/MetJ family transcriptional regulator